jgi:Zn finger protein HypA/HybF involved in hydrogenase expression
MEYNKPLSKCPQCGKKPKHFKKEVYGKYVCEKCNLSTFWSQHGCELELWNAQVENFSKLKVRI